MTRAQPHRRVKRLGRSTVEGLRLAGGEPQRHARRERLLSERRSCQSLSKSNLLFCHPVATHPLLLQRHHIRPAKRECYSGGVRPKQRCSQQNCSYTLYLTQTHSECVYVALASQIRR